MISRQGRSTDRVPFGETLVVQLPTWLSPQAVEPDQRWSFSGTQVGLRRVMTGHDPFRNSGVRHTQSPLTRCQWSLVAPSSLPDSAKKSGDRSGKRRSPRRGYEGLWSVAQRHGSLFPCSFLKGTPGKKWTTTAQTTYFSSLMGCKKRESHPGDFLRARIPV